MEKILLHICCGPCACYPVEYLKDKGFIPAGFFFNPNIHPFSEYKRREETLKELASKISFELTISDKMNLDGDNGWFERTREGWINNKRQTRCKLCYELRLKETVSFAKKNNFKMFTTTLLYSIYQYHDLIKEICILMAEENGLDFFYEDFRKGWRYGIDLSKKYGLYRQRYCGCVFSSEEARRKD